MISRAKDLMKQMSPLVQELETYVNYKDLIISGVKKVESAYAGKRLSFAQYQKELNHFLSGKPLKEVVGVYDNYINYLKRNIRLLNSSILREIYEDKSQIGSIGASIAEELPESKPIVKSANVKMPIQESAVKPSEKEKVSAKSEIEKKRGSDVSKKYEGVEFVSSKPWIESEADESIQLPKSKKGKVNVDDISESIAGIELPKSVKRRLAERTFIGDKTEIPESLVEVETLRREVKFDAKPRIDAELLEREAKRIVGIASKPVSADKVYKPSVLGSVANLFVRKIGYSLIKKYPDLFEKLYTALRLANIGTLSNTYVNIIIFVTLLSFIISTGLFFLFFLFTTYSVGELLIKTFAMGLLASILALISAYYYPFMRISQRSKSINANLPFAINHMSAIASSGLAPDMMLRLVARTREYGEVSVELEKIVDYIDLFGYDLMTAVDTVAISTPNQTFKDVLEGMITNIESGGDLKSYFAQKTDEVIASYKLEKEKNIETISTYSDIYTGIMVSAPLFFVSVLAFVSILGGTIAGIPVQTFISVCTYLVLPLVNIGFLIFLSAAQPEV